MNDIVITPPVGSSAVAAPSPADQARLASPRFQELLEKLQRLAADGKTATEEVDGPERLLDSLRTADDGFVAAMDLRQKLEEAFKKHLQ